VASSHRAASVFIDKTYDGASWSVGVDNFDSTVNADVDLTALRAPAGVAVAATPCSRKAKLMRAVAARRRAHAATG
jgi:hypothetical protein